MTETTVRLHESQGAALTLAGVVAAPGNDGTTLAGDEGNLWIEVDGQAVGSLWFHRDDDGRLVVSLGGWTDDGEWIETEKVAPPAERGGRTIAGEER